MFQLLVPNIGAACNNWRTASTRISGDAISFVVCIDFGTAMSKAGLRTADTPAATPPAIALPIGDVCQSVAPYMAPSVIFVEAGRVTFGPNALRRAKAAGDDAAEPLLSFKTILSATDVAAALRFKVPASVDPTRTFIYREMLTLYLAFLDQLVRRAMDTSEHAALQIAWRYTSPVWRNHNEARSAFARVFDEAAHLSQSLGASLLETDGVSIAHARHALDAAGRAPDLGLLQQEVFEAHAAAQAYAQLCPDPDRAILVFDIGAGTTDLAGFIVSGEPGRRSLEEVASARQCIGVAGDEIDAIIMELAHKKFASKTRAHGRAAARQLTLEVREAKHQIFSIGSCHFHSPTGKRVQIKRSEVEQHPLFREALAALRTALQHSLAPLRAEAQKRGIDKITVILAGGGSNLKFVADLARSVGANIEAVQFAGHWGGFEGQAAQCLPQTAIVIGGALAS